MIDLEWKLRIEDRNPIDQWGVGALLKRLQVAVDPEGDTFLGSAFLDDSKEMLDKSRAIENEIRRTGGTLYTGFQKAEKFEKEIKRYSRLAGSAVKAIAYGQGVPRLGGQESPVEWVPLRADLTALENQWFLISDDPTPIAFVGWEVSDPSLFGLHGITHPNKSFTGFLSDDPRLVAASVRYLQNIRQRVANRPGQDLLDQIAAAKPKRVLLVDELRGAGELEAFLPFILAACRRQHAELFIYDTNAASYLMDYFPLNAPGKPERILDQYRMSQKGRSRVAGFLGRASEFGLDAKAILPSDVGLTQVGYWADKIHADLVVAPSSFCRPSLIQRLQGYDPKLLSSATRADILFIGQPLCQGRANLVNA
jgi:hypothetical protein